MIYNKHNIDIAKIAHKDREPISGVMFSPDKTVATDGFRLLEVSCPNIDPSDFPVIDGAVAIKEFEPLIVNAKTLREIKIPKVKDIGIVSSVAIKEITDDRVDFMTTDLETNKITTAKRVKSDFPDYEQIFPKEEPIAEINLNGKYLAEMLSIMAKLGGNENKVKIKFYGEGKPLLLESGELQKARGLMMPHKQ